MHDPRRHRALTKIATIRAAERDAARHELFLAGQRERDADERTDHRSSCGRAKDEAFGMTRAASSPNHCSKIDA